MRAEPQSKPTFDFQDISAFDHHCHNWRNLDAPFEREQYRLFFTEAVDPRVGPDTATNIYYRWTIRELARVFGCSASENDVLAARAELGHAEVARLLMREANLNAAIIDFGFAGRGSDLFSVSDMGDALGGVPTWGALRLEALLEELVVNHETADAVEEAFLARLNASTLRAERIVSLKSIVAYRTGLDLAPTSRAEGYSSFSGLKATAREQGRVRIADKCFLDYFLGLALSWANNERFPIQFHTGFGDPSVDLKTGNPIAMRPVLEHPGYRDVPIVMLHAGWPYVRESSYLASVYPNVYVDSGLAIPFAASEFTSIWRELLSLAPTSKILWSSDGFALPEHCWFAACQGRAALARALRDLVDLGAIGTDDVRPIAAGILHGNAHRLYGIGIGEGAE
jgi:hypothetical protein